MGPPVEIGHLTTHHQQIVQQMLREECSAFSQGGDDIGCIESLKLALNVQDREPVKRTFILVPKPLHQEMKEYLHSFTALRSVKV